MSLAAPVSIRVSSLGNDSNDGITAPLRHVQAGIDLLCNKIDPCGFQPTIQLEGGTPSAPAVFNEALQLYNYVGSGLLATHTTPQIVGDPAHPESYVIDGGGGTAISSIVTPMMWTLDGFTMQSPGGNNLELDNTGLVYGRNLRFGSAATDILSIINSVFVLAGNISLFGSKQAPWRAATSGIITTQPAWTITLEPSLTISWLFARAEGDGKISIASNINWNVQCPTPWTQSSAVQRSYINTYGNGFPGVSNPSFNDATSCSL